MDDADGADAHRPVFIGGTGRCGTHALAHLLGAHSRYLAIPRELRFHSEPGGLADLLRGELDLARFVTRMRGSWWRREVPWDQSVSRGLHKTVARGAFEQAVGAFELSYERDPADAARALLTGLLDPIAMRAEKPEWVEMTPTNVLAAAPLAELFPRCGLMHIVRDGRDVACSVAGLPWGPDTPLAGLEWWEDRLRSAYFACATLPPGRVLVVRLEELVITKRAEVYEELLTYLDLNDEPGMRAFFSARVTARELHPARWLHLAQRERDEFCSRYDEALARLAADGVDCLPADASRLDGVERSGSGPGSAPPLDPWADGRAADA